MPFTLLIQRTFYFGMAMAVLLLVAFLSLYQFTPLMQTWSVTETFFTYLLLLGALTFLIVTLLGPEHIWWITLLGVVGVVGVAGLLGSVTLYIIT